jgi:hypothetical protein
MTPMLNVDPEIRRPEARRARRPGLITLLMVAMLALAPTAGAFIVNWMPIFGVVNGLDVARLNVALADIPSTPCRVSLAFVDGDGVMVWNPGDFTLRGVEGVFIDFIGDPNTRVGSRIRLRARVTLADALESPGCAVGAKISVEVFDRVTRATRFIMTDTIKSPEPHLAGANQ